MVTQGLRSGSLAFPAPSREVRTRRLTLVLAALALAACGSDSPSSPGATQADSAAVPAEVAAWLHQNAWEFSTSVPVGPEDDLGMLPGLVGSAHVVALGEATHGTGQFFLMKHRVLRYLVEHMGFNAFAIEAMFPEAEAIDEYVRTGKGDPAVLLSTRWRAATSSTSIPSGSRR